MMFASQFRPVPSRDLVEEETDIKVKNWLEEQGRRHGPKMGNICG